MKPFSLYKITAVTLSALAVVALLAPSMSLATGPRVTQSLFEATENEIFAAEQPPLISATMDEEGLVTAIANAALKAGEIEALITTLPLRRMVKYHLTQEQAIAALGSRFSYTAVESKTLVFVPLLVSQAHYIYYRPAHEAGLKWDGTMKSLSGLRYGALKGEDVSAYEGAGIKVVLGSERSLLRKLKSGAVDFMRLTPLASDWLLEKYFPKEKSDFAKMDRAAGDVVFRLAFNSQHKNGAAVAASFKNALEKMVGDGGYTTILESHLGKGDATQAYLKRLVRHLGQ